jgi:hypothetical protein
MNLKHNTQILIEQMQIYDKIKGGFIFFDLWPKQIEFLDLLHTRKKIIDLKKRQVGASQLVGADSVCQCMLQNNFTVLVLSKTGDDSKEFLKRARDSYMSLPEYLRTNPNAPAMVKDTVEEMAWENGSRFISLPASRGAGFTADRVVIDEAAFITTRDAKIDLNVVLRRVEPTLDKAEGQLILVSTANGHGVFRDYFMKAWNGISDFAAFFFSCWDDPTFTEAKRDQIVKDHGEDHANQEYPRDWEEAFLASGRPRFDIRNIQWYEKNRQVEPKLIGNITEFGVEPTDSGFVSFFREKKTQGIYYIVADVAEGLEHGDYSVAKVFDVETMFQVSEWRGHIEPKQFGSVVCDIAKHYNNAYICVEANNHGISTLTRIKDTEEYPDEAIFEGDYSKERADDEYKRPERRAGWMTTSLTKRVIINNLAQKLLQKDIPGLTAEDISELKTYIVDAKGLTNADSGCFDDRVMVMAIAFYVIPLFKYNIPKIDIDRCWICKYYERQIKTCRKTQVGKPPKGYCWMYREKDFKPQWYDYPKNMRGVILRDGV